MRNCYSTLRRLLFASLALLFGSASAVLAAPGDLDLSFGSGGKVVTSMGSGDSWITSVALQSDNKIVAGGCSYNGANYDFALTRYNPNGSPDFSFGKNGKVTTDIDGLSECISGIAIQPDGKIVAGGNNGTPPSWFSSSFLLARYNPDGTLDNSLGARGDGIVITVVGKASNCGVNAVAIQPDGKIVTVGWSIADAFGYGANFTIVRHNTIGSPDWSFGQYGIVTTMFTNLSEESAFTVALQSDGKIVAGGVVSLTDGYAFGLARYDTNGSLDSSFGSGGKVLTYIDEDQHAAALNIAIQSDGRIIAAGRTIQDAGNVYRWTTARYRPNGSLDAAFGTGGIVRTLIGERGIAQAVAIQSNGKIVEIGRTQDAASDQQFALARYDFSGSLDTTFGKGGIVVTPATAGLDSALSGMIQLDGRIVAAGFTSSNGKTLDFALARYMGDAVTRTRFDFDGDGKADQSVFRQADTNWYVLGSRSGFGAIQFGLSTDKLTPADFDGDGRTDIAVFRDGVWFWLNSANSVFRAQQFGLPGDIPVPADYTGDGRAEVAVYRGGNWYALNLVNHNFQAVQFGVSTDKPVPADLDGDGRTDFAVYRDGVWYMLRSTEGFAAIPFGLGTDEPVIGDYDGDAKADPSVYRSGVWYILGSSRGFYATQFGIASDVPVPADYDGDGETDTSVFRDGIWYMLGSQQGFAAVQFGAVNDEPIPAAYLP